MINKEELRIGNILKSHLTGEIVVTDWLVIKHVCDGNLQSIYDIRPVYEPIPLTEELLVKAGFEKIESRLEPIASEYVLSFSFDNSSTNQYTLNATVRHVAGTIVFLSYCVNGYWASTEIRYLHKLQNLFYEIRGTELTIKL